jgi:hypothetical protein
MSSLSTTLLDYVRLLNARINVGATSSGALVAQAMTAAGESSVVATQRTCLGRQTLSVTTAAVSTLTVPTGAVAALVQADGASISITLDGTAPTATVGTRIDDGVIFPVDCALANVKMIARTATTAVQVSYFDRV